MENCSLSPRFPDSPEFGRLVAGAHDVHLARIALEIARDAHPDLDIESYLEKIERLARRTRNVAVPAQRFATSSGRSTGFCLSKRGFGQTRKIITIRATAT